LRLRAIPLGGKVVSLEVPDRHGRLGDIVAGYDSLSQYVTGNAFFGAMIGRFGNRIAKGRFVLEGIQYQLPVNNGLHTLHGGAGGFHNVYWELKLLSLPEGEAIELSYLSKDGEEGFPGNLSVRVVYTLTYENDLVIDYTASSDAITIVNLTHHSFFNLSGNGDVLGHELMINADRFCAVDDTLIPTGELREVKDTAFDFRHFRSIGEYIDGDDLQLKYAKGYDHNFVLNGRDGSLAFAAGVREPLSGRTMEVWTTEPGLQFYSGNFLNGSEKGKGGASYSSRSFFCLEAQHFPDAPNHEHFPSTLLRPGEVYRQKTIYRFGVMK
jgi:aldose 1-epimerase